MAKTPERGDAAPKKARRWVMIALPLALLLGGGSFYAVYSGLVALPLGPDPAETAADGDDGADAPALEPARGAPPARTAFVAVEPLVISLGPAAQARHLKLSVQVETSPEERASVAEVTPRIADVLNTFLRAVDESVLTEPHAMIRLRAQMLRRVRLVSPPGAVRDLLIEEFVLN